VVVDVKVRVTCGVLALSLFILLLLSSRIDCTGRGGDGIKVFGWLKDEIIPV
jgi:hypothetical protein